MQRGTLDGTAVLSPGTVDAAVRPEVSGLAEQGFGWELDQDWYMGELSAPDTYGHTGFTVTSLVGLPAKK